MAALSPVVVFLWAKTERSNKIPAKTVQMQLHLAAYAHSPPPPPPLASSFLRLLIFPLESRL